MKINRRTLKKHLHYDPETGHFIWLVARPRGIRPGDIAGSPIGSNPRGGYWRINVLKQCYCAHRLAFFYMTGRWPIQQIDHRDGNGMNNKWGNIRPATSSQNSYNRRLAFNNTSGFKGVTRHKKSGRWQAQIGGKHHQYLGLFDTAEEAHAAYKEKTVELFGDYARPGG